MATWVWILIAILIVAAVIVAALAVRRRRTAALQDRFGPEYDRTVQTYEDRRTAEAELRARERQRARLDIRPLPEDARRRYAAEWHEVQEQFVDQPVEAVGAADVLVGRVMEARGYPVADFESQADLVSVDHPSVAENYRFAHDVWRRSRSQQATTEDLRKALLRYRSLFEELLRPDGEAAAAAPGGAGAQPAGPVMPEETRPQAAGDRPAGLSAPRSPDGRQPAEPLGGEPSDAETPRAEVNDDRS